MRYSFEAGPDFGASRSSTTGYNTKYQHALGIECVRGGLTMDGKLRVTDTEGVPIAHLYAVGNTGGAFYGNTYPSMIGGTDAGHGMTFGMLTAEEVMGQSRLGN